MSKHTPGPWDVDEVYEDDEQRCIGIVKEGHGYIAGIHILASADTGDTEFTAEDEANAHLIAAAPAMYAALKVLHSVLDQRMPDGRTLNQHLSQEVFECFYGPAIAARAAIAKAEGA